MTFKKLTASLHNAIELKGFEGPLPFQKKIISKIKGGIDLYGIASEGSGKTTALIISTLQKLKSEAFEDAPRALILVKDKEAALDLEEEFKPFIRGTDVRIHATYARPKIQDEIDAIYIGVDIVIATPKWISKLYFLNGINLSQLQLFIIEDAEFISKSVVSAEIIRMTDSIKKCQYIIYTKQMEPKLEKFRDSFMGKSQVVK